MVLDVVLVMLWGDEVWERVLEDKVCFGGGNDGGNDGDGGVDSVA